MSKKPLLAIAIVVMLSLVIVPTEAWIYTDFMEVEEKYDDTRFEKFGPRADRLLIKLYSDAEEEWAAFESCEIDITDWPLTLAKYNQYANPPWSDIIRVASYGPDFDLVTLEINNNNNTLLGNPPSDGPNPMFPNPCSVKSFRQAIAYICDRTVIVPATGIPLYTPVVPSQSKYIHPEIRPGGALQNLCYLYNPPMAEMLLDADGFPIGPDGWRYWDRNQNHVKDAGEELVLKFFIRIDCDGIAYEWGSWVANQLEFLLRIHVTRVYGTNAQAKLQVKESKNFHLYTEIRWIDTTHPNQFINWHWDFYWHPGTPPNYPGCNNINYNEAVDSFLYANTQDDAVSWAFRAQESFADNVLAVPLFCYIGNIAVKRRYSGTPGIPDSEDQYEGELWEGIVNINEVGPDNYWSFLNMHTQCHPWGDCQHMTIRKGFKVPELKSLNPIYAYSLWDREVLDLMYEPLVRRDPYAWNWMPWLVKTYEEGVYPHPIYGICSKYSFTLRPDIHWSDGTPLTIADVYFTFVELPRLLTTLGLPPPSSWWKEVRDIIDFKIIDPCNFEVLFHVKTIWALDWISNIRILPKHIWKPILTSDDVSRITSFAPDPNMISLGPWRLQQYVSYSHVLMVANKPGLTVQTNFPGSTPVTNPYGYFSYNPKHVNVHAGNYLQKINLNHVVGQPPPPPQQAAVNFTITDLLQYQEYVHMCNVSNVPLIPSGWNPIGSIWHLPYRDPITGIIYKCLWQIVGWVDQNAPPGLSTSDLILIAGIAPPTPPIWVHVSDLWIDPYGGHSGHTGSHLEMNVDNVLYAEKYIYLDGQLAAGPIVEIEKPNDPIIEQLTFTVSKCKHEIKVAKHITAAGLEYAFYLCPNNELVHNKWNCTWINVTYTFWVTILEDIGGSYYVNPQLPAPDCKVDLKDVYASGKAFGSYPGHPKWNPVADLNNDYKIDIKDYYLVCKMYGKW